MGDFKKKPSVPQPTDDMSPTPAFGPTFSVAPDLPQVDEQQKADDAETDRQAAAYFHPAWEAVEDKINEYLDAHNPNGGAIVHSDLPADEFKIRMIVDAMITEELNKLMEDIKSAVVSVESRPKREQPTGGK